MYTGDVLSFKGLINNWNVAPCVTLIQAVFTETFQFQTGHPWNWTASCDSTYHCHFMLKLFTFILWQSKPENPQFYQFLYILMCLQWYDGYTGSLQHPLFQQVPQNDMFSGGKAPVVMAGAKEEVMWHDWAAQSNKKEFIIVTQTTVFP